MIIYECPQCGALVTNKTLHNLSHSVVNKDSWKEYLLKIKEDTIPDDY
jgi:hypothetical protein